MVVDLCFVVLVLLLTAHVCATQPRPEHVRYVIVGAGPGGLQLAHYLHSAGRDYIVLEQADHPASFFATFPRWRELISINKAVGGVLDRALRHDWNSLLPEPSTSSSDAAQAGVFGTAEVPCPVVAPASAPAATAANAANDDAASRGTAPLRCAAADFSSSDARFTVDGVPPAWLFRNFSAAYFPHADDLVAYMRGWAGAGGPSGGPLRVRYGARVESVARPPGYAPTADAAPSLLLAHGAPPRFVVRTAGGGALTCDVLVWAAGYRTPNVAEGVNVAALAANYATHSTDVRDYVGKRVLILGRGNSAFEVASHVHAVAATTHVVGRSFSRIRLATETHYVGDVRRVHAQLLESYLLKSADALAEAPHTTLTLAFDNATGDFVVADALRPCAVDGDGRERSRCFWRKRYDVVVSCPGWAFDASAFAPDVRPALGPSGKHPALTPAYEAVGVPGLFVAGTLAHGVDAKVSSGGFIHGFRYVIRALHRHLEEAELAAAVHAAAADSDGCPPRSTSAGSVAVGATEEAPGVAPACAACPLPAVVGDGHPPLAWPRRRVTGLRSATSALLRRINTASGLYQMVGFLVDVLVLPPLSPAAAAAAPPLVVDAAAPLLTPHSHHDPSVVDPTLGPPSAAAPMPPAGARGRGAAARRVAAEAYIDAALAGALFEEVPVGLVREKVEGTWAAQTAGAVGGPRHLRYCAVGGWGADGDPAAPCAAVGGVEYLTLSLEYGSGAPHAAAGAPVGWDPDFEPPPPDPFSPTRANATAWAPHDSKFLHPVLRYFNSAVDAAAPASVLHIIEDFHTDWTAFGPHVLPLARFLQDVGARRVRAAASAGTAAAAASAGSAAAAAAAEWAPRPPPHVSSVTMTIQRLLGFPFSTLYFRGLEVPGATDGGVWHHALSVDAAAALLHPPPGAALDARRLLTHWRDVVPLPLTAAEEAAERARAAAAGDGDAAPRGAPGRRLANLAIARAVAASLAEPALRTPELRRARAEAEAALRAWATNATRADPDLVVISVQARLGHARQLASQAGARAVPTLLLEDASGRPAVRLPPSPDRLDGVAEALRRRPSAAVDVVADALWSSAGVTERGAREREWRLVGDEPATTGGSHWRPAGGPGGGPGGPGYDARF